MSFYCMIPDDTQRARLLPSSVTSRVLVASLFLATCGPSSNAARDAGPPDSASTDGALSGDASCGTEPASSLLDVPYWENDEVDPSLRSLDVYLPERSTCTPVPVVVWVHGGGWAQGDKANNMADKRRFFLEEGWALISINYRLSPWPPSSDPGRVRFPDHVEDVARALAWVSREGPRMGLDPTRMAVLGHSAGAHLVGLVGLDTQYLEAQGPGVHAPKCLGVYDTKALDLEAELDSAGARQRAVIENAFGLDPAVLREASPIRHVRRDAPPVQTARRGAGARLTIHDAFVEALRAVDVPVHIIDAQGLTHEQVNQRIGAEGDDVMTPAVRSFLDTCLAP